MKIASYPQYDNYREGDSGLLDFLIPSHWQSEKARFIFKFNKGLTITKENLEEQGIPCVNYGEIHSKFGFEVDPAKHALKCVSSDYLKGNDGSLLQRGDFLFADTSEDIEGSGNFTHLSSDETTFAGYHTLVARPSSRAETRYLAYMLDSAAFRKQVRKSVKGVKVYSISQGLLKNTVLLLPPLPEQRAIATFLDNKCKKIDEAIRIKEEQIHLLAERRQILIQQAVTRGLNPDVPMKDSGIDWIGRIPAHWEAVPLKRLFMERNERTKTGKETLLSLRMVEGLVPHDDVSDKHIPDANLIDYKMVSPGQMVMNRMRASIGLFGMVGRSGLVSPDYAIFDMRDDIYGPFYLRLFKLEQMGARFRLSSRGLGTGSSGFMRLYTDDFGAISVPVPPSEEQNDIVVYITAEEKKIGGAIALKQSQITALREYKTSLIHEAVTGKIKVI